MNELTFTIMSNDGQEIKCDILFTFEENNKNYIVYTDNELDEDGYPEILASTYTLDGTSITLGEIETDEEWDMIDRKLDERYNEIEEDEE